MEMMVGSNALPLEGLMFHLPCRVGVGKHQEAEKRELKQISTTIGPRTCHLSFQVCHFILNKTSRSLFLTKQRPWLPPAGWLQHTILLFNQFFFFRCFYFLPAVIFFFFFNQFFFMCSSLPASSSHRTDKRSWESERLRDKVLSHGYWSATWSAP